MLGKPRQILMRNDNIPRMTPMLYAAFLNKNKFSQVVIASAPPALANILT